VKFFDRLLFFFAPPLAAVVIRLLHYSLRAEVLGGEKLPEFWRRGEHVVFATWHDQLLLMVMVYRGPGAKILISASKDGELIARIMARFGQGAVRGSSSRGGKEALSTMIDLATESVDLGITPDGPRGPRHQVKAGVAQLARLTGRPVIPLAFVCSHGHRFRSWDRFLFPYPFARGVYRFGQPLYFAEDDSVESFAETLRQAMEENERLAAARLEEHGASAV
jgi:lysophospholipid acyltransferase (LPLAT)-like uncharacterized protein